MAGAVRWAHGLGANAVSCCQAGRSGGVCGRWCKAKVVAIGNWCRRRGSVGGSEGLQMSYVIVIAL